MPKARAASDPVIGRIVDSGRETHARVAKSDLNFVIDQHRPEKLKPTGRFLP